MLYTAQFNATSEMFAFIKRTLHAKYPLITAPDCEWMFINAGMPVIEDPAMLTDSGGWMGQTCLLHASISEYVLLFGSSIETGGMMMFSVNISTFLGHSGRYWAEIIDFVLTGEYWQQPEHTFQKVIYRPGDMSIHGQMEVTHVHFCSDTWMLEYGRGAIPTTMGFALSDSVFSSNDFITIFKYIKLYGKMVLQSLTQGKV